MVASQDLFVGVSGSEAGMRVGWIGSQCASGTLCGVREGASQAEWFGDTGVSIFPLLQALEANCCIVSYSSCLTLVPSGCCCFGVFVESLGDRA